jgi:hypothetical protein
MYKLFTARQVGLSSVLGTSLAGALLIALNRKRLKLGWRGSGTCLAASTGLVALSMFGPDWASGTLSWTCLTGMTEATQTLLSFNFGSMPLDRFSQLERCASIVLPR